MKLLLDSQALLWTMNTSPRLSAMARLSITAPNNVAYVSAVSPYELEWKKAIGKLRFGDILDWPQALAAAGFLELPISAAHSQRAAQLPMHHRDPWGRLLIAQALVEGLTLVTSDTQFGAYGVPTVW